MKRLRQLLVRFAGLFRKVRNDREMSDEFESLLAMHIEDNLQAGMTPIEARRQALIQFGGIEAAKESYRDSASIPFLDNLIQDLRYGLRTLRGSPGFAAAAVLLLALGIGANTAVYSFMDAMLVRALPVKDPQALMVLKWHGKGRPPVIRSHDGESHREPARGVVSGNFPFRVLEFFRRDGRIFTSTFGFFNGGDLTVLVNGKADRVNSDFVSGEFFSGLGLVPAAGRLIDKNDDRDAAPGVAVLSHSYWQARFGLNSNIVGQVISINNAPFSVIGVAPPEFFGVDPSAHPRVYLPIRFYEAVRRDFAGNRNSMYSDDHWYWLQIMGRLRPGVSKLQAEAALSASFSGWVTSTTTSDKERADLPLLYLQDGAAGLDILRHYFSKPLFLLMSMTGLILAIACASVANLLLARASARRREIAMRQALGASRWRVIRQLLTESVLLSALGGVLGVLFAIGGVRGLTVLLAEWQPDFDLRASLNWNVLAVTVTLAGLTGVLFGLAPAIHGARVQLTPALNDGQTGLPSRWFRRVFHGNGLRGALVATQIAISLLLLAGAGLFLRTLSNLQSVARGFNEEKLLLFNLNASQAGYKEESLARFYAALRERLRTVPGVQEVTMSSYALISEAGWGTGVSIPGANLEAHTAALSVGPGFLRTMQIPLVLGRDIREGDDSSAPLIAVINEAFAAKYFPDANPLAGCGKTP